MIKSSVGRGGYNRSSDVLIVQKLLNEYIKKSKSSLKALVEDGINGRKTEAAIVAFQADVVGMARPDGRVDAGGRSIKELEAYKKSGGTKVPSAAIVTPIVKPKQPAQAGTTTGTDPRQLKTRAEIAKVFGSITTEKKWTRQGEFIKGYSIPPSIANDKEYNWVSTYDPKKRKVSTVWCNKTMHRFLDAALKNLQKKGILGELKQYGGCFNIRATRGTTNWSAHSWGLAIDLNMTGNGLGQTPSLSKEFVQCFKDAGFGWGGDYKSRKDGMHFTIAGFDMPRS